MNDVPNGMCFDRAIPLPKLRFDVSSLLSNYSVSFIDYAATSNPTLMHRRRNATRQGEWIKDLLSKCLRVDCLPLSAATIERNRRAPIHLN
ncbi:MAG: hypothetical protein VYA34_16120 [Myxococcota bacterium]|nr:hypothetical protein [Myxococcota bacterium]